MVQSWFEHNLDTYTRRARLSSALVVVLPLTLSTLIFFPNELTLLGVIVSLLVCCGGTALLAQVGRDMGKGKEENLFTSWDGGKPTTRILRYSTAPNLMVLAQRHQKLQELLPNLPIPTEADEAANPKKANEAYEACVAFLRGKTRDKEKFSLVFEENCNYGFRRNLWGMKPIGIAMSVLGVLLAGGVIVANFLFLKSSIPPLAIMCGIVNLLLLILWVFLFTPTWVKIAADAYAERLLEFCENL